MPHIYLNAHHGVGNLNLGSKINWTLICVFTTGSKCTYLLSILRLRHPTRGQRATQTHTGSFDCVASDTEVDFQFLSNAKQKYGHKVTPINNMCWNKNCKKLQRKMVEKKYHTCTKPHINVEPPRNE
jgi:hypothetical protein